MKRQTMYFRMITASIARRKSRMLVALLAVTVGATILAGLVMVYYDMPRQMGEQFLAYGANMIFVPSADSEGMTEDEIVRKKHEVAAWLINAERATLVMDSDITREYQAEVVTEALLNRKDWANGYLKVKFTVQPVSKSVEVSEVETEVVTIPNEHCTIDLSELVPNGIGHETPLSIKITHKGGDTVTWLRIRYDYHSNSQIVLAHESFKLQESDSVLIDSEDGHVVLEDQGSDSTGHWANVTSGVWCIESGNFPALSVNGLRSLTIKTDAAATLLVEVSCNARWV